MAFIDLRRHTRAPMLPGMADFDREPDEEGNDLSDKLCTQLADTGFIPEMVFASGAPRAIKTAKRASRWEESLIIKINALYPAVIDALTARYELIYDKIGNDSIAKYIEWSGDNTVLAIGDRAWGMHLSLIPGNANLLSVTHGNMPCAMAASICWGRQDLLDRLWPIKLAECEGIRVETDAKGMPVDFVHYTMPT